jgi:hypothetical protein
MGSWTHEERRQTVRYDVALFVKMIHGLKGDETFVTSHDISANGVGLLVDRPLMLGEIVDLTFVMPDNEDQVETRGMILWVCALEQNRYRAGVEITEQKLRPIPMVLRSIKVRISRYNC